MVKDDVVKVELVRPFGKEMLGWVIYFAACGVVFSVAFPNEAANIREQVTNKIDSVRHKVSIALTLREIENMPETDADNQQDDYAHESVE
jgi:hypothetical protein